MSKQTWFTGGQPSVDVPRGAVAYQHTVYGPVVTASAVQSVGPVTMNVSVSMSAMSSKEMAIEWLTEVFGFQERTSIRHTDPDGTISRTQMEVVDSLITLGRPSVHGESPRSGVSSMLYVYVDNVDEHYASLSSGELAQEYGSPTLMARRRTAGATSWRCRKPASSPMSRVTLSAVARTSGASS